MRRLEAGSGLNLALDETPPAPPAGRWVQVPVGSFIRLPNGTFYARVQGLRGGHPGLSSGILKLAVLR